MERVKSVAMRAEYLSSVTFGEFDVSKNQMCKFRNDILP